MRNHLIAVAGVVSLVGLAAGGTAAAGGRPAPAITEGAAAVSYLFPGLGAATTGAAAGHSTGLRTAAPSQTEGPTYSYNKVPFPGSYASSLGGINKHGEMTGTVNPTKSTIKIFTATETDLANPKYYTFPFTGSAVTAQTAGIDSAGDFVGNYANADGVFHGFEQGHRGIFATLKVPGAGTNKDQGTDIAGISPGGIIVGSFVGGSANAATGFIDDHGKISDYSEPNAGHAEGQGTAVEFDYDGVYGGLYVDADNSAHGWYVKQGKLHTVNDPAAGTEVAHAGTQLVGIDKTGRLYGIVSPASGITGSFSYEPATPDFTVIQDPEQVTTPPAEGTDSGTIVLGVTIYGTIAGNYAYQDDPKGLQQTQAFFGRPKTS